MPDPTSPHVDPDAVLPGAQSLSIGLLYGPVVQFAQPTTAAQQGVASIVAMPPQLPLSVDTIFHYPPGAVLPDNLAHFCFAPVLKLHEPSELSFCLTDSTGAELYGVSVQVLSPHGSSPDRRKHRPVALFMLSGRPIYAAMSRLLHLLLPLIQQAGKLPTTKRTTELSVRASKNQFGMGLNMSPANGNVILSVEPGGMAAKDRRLRPGDSITALDGETLGSVKLSEALRLRAEAEAANGAPVVQERGQPPGVRTHQLTVTRTHEVLADGSPPLRALTHVCRRSIVMLRKREQDLRWLVGNPFWLPAPLEPLFSRLSWSVPDVAYLLASCLTDHKVLLIGSDPTVLLPCAQALRALLAPLGFSSTYIPYLPATLLSPSDAHTLLCDSTSPFLVGTHVSLHQTIAADGQTLSDELVVADLDRGVVTPSASPHSDFFPTSIAGLGQMAPPVGGLIKALHPHVSADHFDEGAVQAACLQFVADLLNIGDGALTDSSHPTDLAAKATWQILRDFEEDVRLRCERDSDTKPHVKLLKAKLTDGLSASLASVCQKVNLAGGLAQQPEVAKSAFTRSGSLSRTDRPSSPFLSLVYASRAFRHWWLTHESESTHEQKMCVSYRSYDLNLADHLDDHKRALQCVEASLYDELEKAAAGAPADESPASSAAPSSGGAASPPAAAPPVDIDDVLLSAAAPPDDDDPFVSSIDALGGALASRQPPAKPLAPLED